MAQVDYYQLLGISPAATFEEVRRAYRQLAWQVHPDTNPQWEDDAEANRRMAAVNEAYAVLRDATRRAEYDLLRHRRMEEAARRARASQHAYAYERYTQAGPRPGTRAQTGTRARTWTRLVFRPSVDRQIMWATVAILLVVSGVFGISMAIDGLAALGTLITLGGFVGGALAGMAALPSFQGYVVLTREAMIVYPPFGLFRRRVYRYDQICDVHTRVQRRRYGSSVRIMIDYFQWDAARRLNQNFFYSKWLPPVDDPRALSYILKREASARKLPFSKPTWWAVVVGARDLFAFMAAAFGVMAGIIFFGCGSL